MHVSRGIGVDGCVIREVQNNFLVYNAVHQGKFSLFLMCEILLSSTLPFIFGFLPNKRCEYVL